MLENEELTLRVVHAESARKNLIYLKDPKTANAKLQSSLISNNEKPDSNVKDAVAEFRQGSSKNDHSS